MTPLLFAALLEVAQYQPPFRHLTPLRDSVKLVLTTDRDSYYPGELFSIRIVATNISGQPVEGYFTFSTVMGDAELLHASPGSVLQPISGLIHHTEQGPLRSRGRREILQPGKSSAGTLVVSVTDPWKRPPNVGDAILQGIGTHRLSFRYADTREPNGVLEAETITVEVVSPPDEEAAAAAAYTPSFGYIAQLDWGEGFLSLPLQAAAEEFIQNFPNSRYTPPLKSGLRNWLEYRRRGPDLTNDDEKARLERLKTADSIPPTLSVSPTVATIWPPNRAMVLVGINATVSDNSGGIPVVKLVSITCDDSCNSADIAEAAFGTDDRAFKLRADRTGGGKGRTYTITYEATDASGNKATATTTVIVPHDQGKKKKPDVWPTPAHKGASEGGGGRRTPGAISGPSRVKSSDGVQP